MRRYVIPKLCEVALLLLALIALVLLSFSLGLLSLFSIIEVVLDYISVV